MQHGYPNSGNTNSISAPCHRGHYQPAWQRCGDCRGRRRAFIHSAAERARARCASRSGRLFPRGRRVLTTRRISARILRTAYPNGIRLYLSLCRKAMPISKAISLRNTDFNMASATRGYTSMRPRRVSDQTVKTCPTRPPVGGPYSKTQVGSV